MKKLVYLLSISILLTSCAVKQQETKLIFKDGKEKTTNCKTTSFGVVKCYEQDGSEPILYDRRNLRSIEKVVNGKIEHYDYINYTKMGWKLALLVVEGEVSLYDIKAYSNGSYSIMVVKKRDSDVAEWIGFDYGFEKKRVKKYFNDCPILLEKLENNEFKNKKAIDIVNFHNENCK